MEERGRGVRQRRRREKRSRRQQCLKKRGEEKTLIIEPPSRVESDGCEGTRSRRPALGTSGSPV